MSATVTNDAFLVKGLRLSPSTITEPLVFEQEKWSGEKMILLPSLMSSTLNRVKIVNEMAKPKQKRPYGVVALVPSFATAEYWKQCGASVATTETIDNEIEKLKAGLCDAVLVLASRYDGVDLPDSSCRILIFDSLPSAQNLVDAYADSTRSQSEVTALRVARTVEQGLGRSVRGERDYCAIVVTGPELVKMVRSQKTRSLLSAETTKQIEIGLEIAKMAKDEGGGAEPFAGFMSILNQCLSRDAGWKQFYAQQMDELQPPKLAYAVLEIFQFELQAELAYEAGDPQKAIELLQTLIDKHVIDDGERGWYLQEMARYANSLSKSYSEKLQRDAHAKNHHLMRPMSGMRFEKIQVVAQKRASNILSWVSTFENFEELRLASDEVLGRLEFGVKADRFEDAVLQLGRMLGFESQRPEREWKEGPDNLWAVKEGEYFVIECKSEVKATRVEINKGESGQMNNACAWFKNNYPGAVSTNIIVIPTKKVSDAAGFLETVYALRKSGLAGLVSRCRQFWQEFAGLEFGNISEEKVQQLLNLHALDLPHLRNSLEPTVQG